VIGGLFSSTLITLVFLPVVYSIFEGRDSNEDNQPGGAGPLGTAVPGGESRISAGRE